MVKKVWVNYKEKYHGQHYDFWKNKTLAQAHKETQEWNMFNNPEEHLSIKRVSAVRPKGLRPTSVKGIYKAPKSAKIKIVPVKRMTARQKLNKKKVDWIKKIFPF